MGGGGGGVGWGGGCSSALNCFMLQKPDLRTGLAEPSGLPSVCLMYHLYDLQYNHFVLCCSYVWKTLDIGYVQGMCDLVAPLLVIFDDGELLGNSSSRKTSLFDNNVIYAAIFVCRGDHLQLFCGPHAKNEQQFPTRRSYGYALRQHEIVDPSTFASLFLTALGKSCDTPLAKQPFSVTYPGNVKKKTRIFSALPQLLREVELSSSSCSYCNISVPV